jgi:hypothetical protein
LLSHHAIEGEKVMGFLRVRRSIKLLPGVRLNFSKTGASTTVGGRGAHVTYGYGKVRSTVGLPGTGMSYTNVRTSKRGGQASSPFVSLVGFVFFLWLLMTIFGHH